MRRLMATFTGMLVACGEPRGLPVVASKAAATERAPAATQRVPGARSAETNPAVESDAPQGSNALFRRYPTLSEHVAWVSLGQFPTPVERLHELERELGVELYVKRDDLSAVAYGGGKPRKLEFRHAAFSTDPFPSLVESTMSAPD